MTISADLLPMLVISLRHFAHIIRTDARSFGTYHFTNEGETTWFQFARAIYDLGRKEGLIRRQCKVLPITTDRYPTRAARPKYSVLSKAKIVRTFDVAVPTWQDALMRFFVELREATQ